MSISRKQGPVFVALSGGVDSSVAAALLVRQGISVVGVFMKNWENTAYTSCPWEEDQKDALRVCRILRIPMKTWHFEREYAKRVLRNFFAEYERGRTPNPDVVCNREIKFGLFLRRALREGAQGIATGHYAQLRHTKNGVNLLRGADGEKDQSYFLWQLSQAHLQKTLFPVGHLHKPVVRKLARRFDLPTAEKPDSQGICFVGEVHLKNFLRQRIPERPGLVLTLSGRRIGTHGGVAWYTIGQRHGFTLDPKARGPYFVVRKDRRRNALIVVRKSDSALFRKTAQVTGVRWISGHPPALPVRCTLKIRYRQPDQTATIRSVSGGISITFANPQRAVTPGQSAVFYQGNAVLGGGIIAEGSTLAYTRP